MEILIESKSQNEQSLLIDGKKFPAASCDLRVAAGCLPEVTLRVHRHQLTAFLKKARVRLVVRDVLTGEEVEMENVEFVAGEAEAGIGAFQPA